MAGVEQTADRSKIPTQRAAPKGQGTSSCRRSHPSLHRRGPTGPTNCGADLSVVTDGSCDRQHLRMELIDVLRGHGGLDSDDGVQEVGSIDRLWSGKSKQFDAR